VRRLIPVLVLAGALLVAGCATPSADQAAPPSQGTPPSPTADPRDALTVVKESFQRSFDAKTFAMNVRISAGARQSAAMTAAADLAAGNLRIAMKAPLDMEIVKLDKDIFIKMSEQDGKPWLRLQVDKLRSTSSLRDSTDLTQHSGVLGGVKTAEKRDSAAGSTTYEGVADLKLAAESGTGSAKSQMETLSRLARNASEVPYTATVDDQGRLIELSYTVVIPAGSTVSEIELTDLGKPVTITPPPAAEVADATEEHYAYF